MLSNSSACPSLLTGCVSSPVQWVSVQGTLKPCRGLWRQSCGCKACLFAPAALAHSIHCCYSQAIAGACLQALQLVQQVTAMIDILKAMAVIVALQPTAVAAVCSLCCRHSQLHLGEHSGVVHSSCVHMGLQDTQTRPTVSHCCCMLSVCDMGKGRHDV